MSDRRRSFSFVLLEGEGFVDFAPEVLWFGFAGLEHGKIWSSCRSGRCCRGGLLQLWGSRVALTQLPRRWFPGTCFFSFPFCFWSVENLCPLVCSGSGTGFAWRSLLGTVKLGFAFTTRDAEYWLWQPAVLQSNLELIYYFLPLRIAKLMIVGLCVNTDFHHWGARLQGRFLYLKFSNRDDYGSMWLYYSNMQWAQFFRDSSLCSKILIPWLPFFILEKCATSAWGLWPRKFLHQLQGSCNTILPIDVKNNPFHSSCILRTSLRSLIFFRNTLCACVELEPIFYLQGSIKQAYCLCPSQDEVVH